MLNFNNTVEINVFTVDENRGFAHKTTGILREKLISFAGQVVTEFLKYDTGRLYKTLRAIYLYTNRIVIYTQENNKILLLLTVSVPIDVFVNNDIVAYVKDEYCRQNVRHYKYCACFATSTLCNSCTGDITGDCRRFSIKRFNAEHCVDMR